MSKPTMQSRVLGALLGAAAAFAGQRLASGGWRTLVGEEPPDPADPTVPTSKAFAWALGSTVVLTALALVAQRYTAGRAEKRRGEVEGA